MKTHNSDPNFSIVMPGGCNAQCPFCFNQDHEKVPLIDAKTYLGNLGKILRVLSKEFYQISITGGEPMISPMLAPVLGLLVPFKDKYTNILLTTNGSHLLDKINIVSSAVDHINISRHHWDAEENGRIFGGSYVMTDSMLSEIIREYEKVGIDVSVNCVINDDTTKEFILKYIEWSRLMGVFAIRFRKENGSLTPALVENEFSDYKVLWEGRCPACRTKQQRINGVNVYWKYSTLEPSDIITDTVFELLYEPNGNVYMDWGLKKKIDVLEVARLNKEIADSERARKNLWSHTRESSSCGGNTSSCGGSSSRC